MARLPYVIPYAPEFLGGGFQVDLPIPSCPSRLTQNGRIFDYIHFSLLMHRDRRTALLTAHNVDVAQRRSVPRTGWDLDSRLNFAEQTGPAAYANNPWDRGHVVRRAAVAWGSPQEAKDASDSTFYYTNAAPQHERFNQDEWLALEDWVLNAAGGAASRLCVFTGPLYTLRDEFDEGVRIPSAFWKVVALRDPTADGLDLSSLGFVMKQSELWNDWGGADLLDLHAFQVGIADIGRYTGLDFGVLATLDEFEWRQPRFRDRSRMRPVPIQGPEDIRFFGDRRRAHGVRALRIGSPPESGPRARDGDGGDGCGCHDDKPGAERVEALSRQVAALREVVDAILDQEAEEGDRTSRALREASLAYARIVGGQMTLAGEFDECACIGNGDRWFCSGVLIHPRVVLTAAHCAPEISRVYLGGRSINLTAVQGEVVEVERVAIHPGYHPHSVPSHDIAVLVLAEDAETPPVELATEEELAAEDNVTLVGFGYDHPTEQEGFGTKRRVDVPLTNLQGLAANIVAELEFMHGFAAPYEFHAGLKGLGKDSCNGDSGGPSFLRVGDQFKLVGVTSRAAFSSSLPCGDGGIYTSAPAYRDWLNQATDGLVAGDEPSDAVPEPASGLYVSAALPNPTRLDAGAEWVEITNVGTSGTSLEGYFVADRQGGRHRLSGPLSAQATRRVMLPADSPVKLGNRGDEIVLLRGDDEIHRVTYAAAGSGEILRFGAPVADGGNGGDGGDGGDGTFEDADPC